MSGLLLYIWGIIYDGRGCFKTGLGAFHDDNEWLYLTDKTMDIDVIRGFCKGNALRWTNHIFTRLLQRNITIDDVINVLMKGEIIEQYPDDYPYPSCLVLGLTVSGRYLHIVCGGSETELWLITAYYPNPDDWSDDFKVRKESIT
jgi:hypothetical protein